jgi:hypothetical protein
MPEPKVVPPDQLVPDLGRRFVFTRAEAFEMLTIEVGAVLVAKQRVVNLPGCYASLGQIS